MDNFDPSSDLFGPKSKHREVIKRAVVDKDRTRMTALRDHFIDVMSVHVFYGTTSFAYSREELIEAYSQFFPPADAAEAIKQAFNALGIQRYGPGEFGKHAPDKRDA